MRTEGKTVLLVGASGLVGSHVLTRLLAEPRVAGVIAPVRRPLARVDARLQAPLVDFDALPDTASMWAVDAVICTLGTTMAQAGSREAFRRVDFEYPLQIAARARQHGATAFALTSAMGADARSRFFYNRVKGELEAALRAQGWPSLTFVRPGLIAGERSGRRPAEHLAGRVLGALGPILPRRFRASPAPRIADALVDHALAATPGVGIVDAAALA
ncbi:MULTISPECIES: NAD(P)H-binding protein [Luteimonas]|uniref:NAD-dependent dehydratase n=1 Tax=Luteimonas chenhongjianii TaxID=2006110 RepID=A0A290XCY0_9GAMM|nr:MULTISPECIES: NAD(P)H-binding protein [Luteimonas]ATD66848.1 NAD-dependent dehydratase [Luteimonas chenhongjianii]RPD84564.1 NAD-dependent epimerase/dehydratase family protein [Luteimonas sp. 100069]